MASSGVAAHEDEFPVDWHPHRGMDLLSYIKSGVGRHGDSMGNRETFATPGMQWVSAGSGIEHAEGGGTPAGDTMKGFQIWINVPSTKKMDDPRYGTHPPSDIPLIDLGFGATARLLAGKLDDSPDYGARGPFQTAANVTMVDLELAPGAALNHSVPRGLDTALLYVYEGSAASINGAPVGPQSIVQFDAGDDEARGLDLVAGGKGLAAMLFAGKRLNEPIAWHGPIVMNTQAELRQCFSELRAGTFPPIKVEWPGRGGYKIAANGRKAASAGAAAAT